MNGECSSVHSLRAIHHRPHHHRGHDRGDPGDRDGREEASMRHCSEPERRSSVHFTEVVS